MRYVRYGDAHVIVRFYSHITVRWIIYSGVCGLAIKGIGNGVKCRLDPMNIEAKDAEPKN